MADKKVLISWLNDAYAMERSMIKTLEKHKEDAKVEPQLERKIDEHIQVTKDQAEQVKNCLKFLGEDVSTMKTITGDVMGWFQGMQNKPMGYTVVKNTGMEYTAENFEIGAYTAIIAAAEKLEQTDIADICRGIVLQEKDMANWLYDFIPELVQHQLDRE